MLFAKDDEERRLSVERLRPYQRADFEGIFRAMQGRPVTVRRGRGGEGGGGVGLTFRFGCSTRPYTSSSRTATPSLISWRYTWGNR